MNHNKGAIAFFLLQLSSVLCQEASCENCCSDEVMLHVTAELCFEYIWCHKSEWTNGTETSLLNGTKYEKATVVRIFPEKKFNVVRRCAVQNFEKLETIYGENAGIEVIDSEAFWNLPGLRNVYFAFNLVKEVQFGVFSNLPITTLDLSWNEIEFITENAFSGMNNLKNLNISHNKLTEFDIFYSGLLLDELVLSYNFLTEVKLRGNHNFNILDLSFNRLKFFIIDYLREYKKIDLTNNNLRNLAWGGGTIGELKISLNNLTDMELLVGEEKNLTALTLFPNPWKCDQLNTYFKELIEKNVTITDPKNDRRLNFLDKTYPVCAMPDRGAYEEYNRMRSEFIKDVTIPCVDDKGCPNFMICRTNQCLDPCDYNPCRKQSCVTRNHRFTCRCPKGMLTNYLELFSQCHVPCYEKKDYPSFYAKRYVKCDVLHHVCVYGEYPRYNKGNIGFKKLPVDLI